MDNSAPKIDFVLLEWLERRILPEAQNLVAELKDRRRGSVAAVASARLYQTRVANVSSQWSRGRVNGVTGRERTQKGGQLSACLEGSRAWCCGSSPLLSCRGREEVFAFGAHMQLDMLALHFGVGVHHVVVR